MDHLQVGRPDLLAQTSGPPRLAARSLMQVRNIERARATHLLHSWQVIIKARLQTPDIMNNNKHKMKLTTIAILSSVVTAQNFVPPEGTHGTLVIESSNQKLDKQHVTIGNPSRESTTAHVAYNKMALNGHFQLLDSSRLMFLGSDDKKWAVSIDKDASTKQLPAMTMDMVSVDTEDGWAIKDGYLTGPGGYKEFYICTGAQYPNGELVTYFGSKQGVLLPSCSKANLKWQYILY